MNNLILSVSEIESKVDIAREILSIVEVNRFKEAVMHRFYSLLFSYVDIEDSDHNQVLNLPKNIMSLLNLDSSKTDGIYYTDVLECFKQIDDISQYTHRLFLIEIYNYAYNFYTKNDSAHTVLKNRKQLSENEITHIYKLRNQIVHNAKIESNVLPHIIRIAHHYCVFLLRDIVDYFKEGKIEYIHYFVRRINDHNIMSKELKNENIEDIFSY